MNIWRTILAGAVLLIGTTASACAATPYVSGSAGIAMMEDSDLGGGFTWPYDTGYAVTGAVGLDSGNLRLEGEIGYQNNGIEESDIDVSMVTYMANGYIDLDLPINPVTPYLTAGIGLADIKTDGLPSADDSSTVLAGQVGVGAGFSIAPMIKLDAKYRYLITADAEFDGVTDKISIDSHNVMLGLRIGL
ncbi:outer membrane protein [Chlorobium sp.]|uniref:outer membrane protein n=1 Tax=Chlorobium sp. TaxID=1095 RepID=UPI002F42379F